MTFTILTILEVLIINLFHTHILSNKRYSNLMVFTVLFVFSLFLMGLLNVVGIQSETTVKSIFVGLIYWIPLYLIYDISGKKLLAIMIYCWTYTISIGTLSYGLISLFEVDKEIMYIFILQTTLMISSVMFVIKFSKNKFKKILDKSDEHIQNLLIILGASIFLLFVSIRFFVEPTNSVFLSLTVFLSIITITSYILLYTIVQSNLSLTSTRTIAYKDTLTGISNRYSLFRDMASYINENHQFSLLFMDLDNLKSVNDQYSHHIGDQYLKEFAHVLEDLVANDGHIYRFAGDEFVGLIKQSSDTIDVLEFEKNIEVEMNKTYEFKGVSIGVAHYPEDGVGADELINQADIRMYGEKRSRKIRR